MRRILLLLLIFLAGCGQKNNRPNNNSGDVEVFVTTADKSELFSKKQLAFNDIKEILPNTITINPEERFQTIDGFGAAISGSSAYNLTKMSKSERTKLLTHLFSLSDGIGLNYIRVSIGCSDFSLDEYSCQEKPGIENFDIPLLDRQYLVPILKEIIAINPKIKIMGSPWTPPRWMKVNNLEERGPHNFWHSGQLNPNYYKEYAEYFVKWIKSMEQEGIGIESITIQNEPLNKGNSASLYMTWQEQRDFIKNALGPAFQKHGITTKILIFDHNYNYDDIADQNDYPHKILADAEAAKYIDGSAYHAYGGDKSELLDIQSHFPNKNLYFTEISIGGWGGGFGADLLWNMREVFIGTINNYSKAVIVWNLMLDDTHGPKRPGGCSNCYGVVDINKSDYKTLTYNCHYYNLAHSAKVIKPGGVRIGISGYSLPGIFYTAVKNIDNSYGVIAQNDNDKEVPVIFALGNRSFSYSLPAKSITSFLWN